MSQDRQSACEWCSKQVPMYLLEEMHVPVETEEGLFSEIVFICQECLDDARRQQTATDMDAPSVCNEHGMSQPRMR